MKRIFAILFSMALIISTFNTRTEAAGITSKSVVMDIAIQNSPEEGKITLEFLQQMSSWEKLVNTFNSNKSYSFFENSEDFCCVVFIESINKDAITIPIYHDIECINIIKSYYKPYNELKEQVNIDTSKRRMLHVCTEDTDLGWVYAEDVVFDCK